jgi:branched-subunit amino acid aminotransferase/4-amino-4-deoxychorismate lyase
MTDTQRIEIDGHPATPKQLRLLVPATYGHFTAMQVRGGRVRGLELHLNRLDAANRELFGTGIDREQVRAHVRRALRTDRDASVRVHVVDRDGGTLVLVTVRPPGGMPGRPLALLPVPYQRALPHIKRTNDFGQAYYRRLAARNGCDDALLTGPGGVVSECGIANLACFDGTSVVWPDAPALAGITMQLLEPRLAGAGLPTRRGPVHLSDLDARRPVFVTNARGIAPVDRIDDRPVPVDRELMRVLDDVYGSVPGEPI